MANGDFLSELKGKTCPIFLESNETEGCGWKKSISTVKDVLFLRRNSEARKWLDGEGESGALKFRKPLSGMPCGLEDAIQTLGLLVLGYGLIVLLFCI